MKKLVVFSIHIIALIAFTSCSKDDDGASLFINSESLVGEWSLTNVSSENVKLTTNNNGTVVDINLLGKDLMQTYNFSESPKVLTISGGYTLEATFILNGISNTAEEVYNESGSSTWALDGKTLRLEREQQQLSLEVVGETPNSITLKTNIAESIFGNEGVASGFLVFTLTRR